MQLVSAPSFDFRRFPESPSDVEYERDPSPMFVSNDPDFSRLQLPSFARFPLVGFVIFILLASVICFRYSEPISNTMTFSSLDFEVNCGWVYCCCSLCESSYYLGSSLYCGKVLSGQLRCLFFLLLLLASLYLMCNSHSLLQALTPMRKISLCHRCEESDELDGILRGMNVVFCARWEEKPN